MARQVPAIWSSGQMHGAGFHSWEFTRDLSIPVCFITHSILMRKRGGDQGDAGFHLLRNVRMSAVARERAASNSPCFWLKSNLPAESSTAMAGIPRLRG